MVTPTTVHLFLVNVTPGQDLPTKPPLPGMPDPVHVVDVHIWSLEYDNTLGYVHGDLDTLDMELVDVTQVSKGRAVMDRRRLSPWTQAKRSVMATLDSLYTTPNWSINWATTRQAHSGRGRWKNHTEVMDSVADWSRDQAAEWLEGGLDPYALAGYRLDKALADNGGDMRNWVGLGTFTGSKLTSPDFSDLHGVDVDFKAHEARWVSWN